MPSFSQSQKSALDRKAKIVKNLTAEWDGIDHPLWRNEAAEKLQFAIETLLCIIAMNEAPTPESNAAAAALIFITDWDEEEFLHNVNDVSEKVMLVNSQEGGMQ